jgi:HEAT repeat protein
MRLTSLGLSTLALLLLCAFTEGASLPRLETTLARKPAVRFQRAHLGEALYELQVRIELQSAYPPGLKESLLFDFDKRGASVEEMLEAMAAAGELKLEYRGDVVVFWKPADDAYLRALDARIKDPRERSRCAAIEELGQLADRRIYPILFWAMAEGTEPMAVQASRVLASHATTLRYAEEFAHLEAGLTRLLAVRPDTERIALCSLAGASHSPRCGRPLLPLLPHLAVGSYALGCIGQTRDPRTVAPLLALLKDAPPVDPNDDTGYQPVTRESIIAALGDIGSREAVTALADLAAKEKNPHERLLLAWALLVAGDERGHKLLLDLLKIGEPKYQRRPAGGPGGGRPAPLPPFRVQVAQAMAERRDERALDLLLEQLDDPEGQVRSRAAWMLADMRDPRATEKLIALLPDDKARVSAMYALDCIGDPRAIEPVAKWRKDPASQTRMYAGEFLLHLGDPRGAETLLECWSKLPDNYHDAVLRDVALAGDQRAIDALVARLKPDGTRAARDAADTLGEVRDLATIEPLVATLSNKDVNASFAAAAALGKMRHPQAVDRAAKLLAEESPAQREWGARILGWLKDPRGEQALVGALNDEDVSVRTYAGRALVEIGTRAGRDAATKMLDDPDSLVRNYVAQALAPPSPYGVDMRLVEELIHSSSDDDSGKRAAACKALGNVSDPCVIDPLIATLKDLDPQVQAAARSALQGFRDSAKAKAALAGE